MIAVVVVGYNNLNDLEDCLKSILANSEKNIKIFYVDNDSRDASIDFVQNHFKSVQIIKNKNTGYAGGNNVGIKMALKLGCKNIFLLNPDTILDSNCLALLKKASDQKTIIQPIVLIYEKGTKTHLINTTGNYLNFLGISYCNNYRQDEKIAQDGPIVSASGAAMFIPSAVIEKIGYLDESFFMYHEDLDFCWRARMAGFNVELLTTAKVWHKYSFSKNKLKYFYIERNRFLFIFKNFQIKTIFLILPFLLLNEILMLLYSIVSGWFIYKLKSCLSFFYLLPSALRERKKNKRLFDDRVLKQFLSSQVEFSEVKVPGLKIYSRLSGLYFAAIRKFI